MADDESWFNDEMLARARKKRRTPEPPPPPPLQRGDAVELAIEVEKELGLAEGAAVVRARVLWRQIGGVWAKVRDHDMARLLMLQAGRGTPAGPLRLTPKLVREAVGLLKQRWPVVRELPVVKEASVAMFEKYLRAGPEERLPHG